MAADSLQRPCPVCRNTTGVLLHTQEFVLSDNHTLSSRHGIVACEKCGFAFADIPSDQEIYDKYYTEMSRYDTNYTCTDSSLYVDRAAWISNFVRCRSDSIIDVGCGNGQLILELGKHGLSDLTGLDPSEKCISDLRSKGIRGIVSSVFSISTSKKYECAILSGVLEHIYDVRGIMATMKHLIKRRGLLFVCVPDASRYRDFDEVPFDYFNVEHINHFDETSLLNLGLQHGFTTIGFLKTTITLFQTKQPIIFCALENVENPATNAQLYSQKRIADYVQHTQGKAVDNTMIERLIETNEEIIVWGAGNFTSRMLAISGLNRCNIVMIVDNDKHKQGTTIGGKIVRAPNAILSMPQPYTILVAAAVFHNEILAEIKQMKLPNNVAVLR
jgi:SAM-dependent methyltransferase